MTHTENKGSIPEREQREIATTSMEGSRRENCPIGNSGGSERE